MLFTEFQHRFRKNPWPWLLLFQTVILLGMWFHEYTTLLSTHKKPWDQVPRHVQMLDDFGYPQFIDPFGSFYSLRRHEVYSYQKPFPADPFNWALIVQTRNADYSSGRMFYLTFSWFHHYSYSTNYSDAVVPSIFLTSYAGLAILGFRHNRRHRRIAI